MTPPYTSTNTNNAYATDATAAAVLTGIYTKLTNFGATSLSIPAISTWGGLSADEFTLYSGSTDVTMTACYTNQLTAQTPVDMWGLIYPYVFYCNAAISGLDSSASLTPAVKQQLLGEAKFMRAFFYFYLINLYGDAPLVLSTDYTKTAIVPRSPKSQIYQQIINDLFDAEGLLSDNYVDAATLQMTTERTRPNKWVAAAFLSRVYLYIGDYGSAETLATEVINNSSLYSLTDVSNTFLKNSSEAIWQLQPTGSGSNTPEARSYILPASGPSLVYPVYLNNSLVNDFEAGDQRKINWIDSVSVGGSVYYYPYKYKINAFNSSIVSYTQMTEYSMVIRLAELYLIRAEARAQEGNIIGAISDIDSIRIRAGVGHYTGATDLNSVLSLILHERRVELFSEWGHRWFDLKRTLTVDSVMNVACPQKGGVWSTYKQQYPLSTGELFTNSDLVQNVGYN